MGVFVFVKEYIYSVFLQNSILCLCVRKGVIVMLVVYKVERREKVIG